MCNENGDPPCIVKIERNISPSDDEAPPAVQQSIIVATADSKDDCSFIQLVLNFKLWLRLQTLEETFKGNRLPPADESMRARARVIFILLSDFHLIRLTEGGSERI